MAKPIAQPILKNAINGTPRGIFFQARVIHDDEILWKSDILFADQDDAEFAATQMFVEMLVKTAAEQLREFGEI